MSVIIFFMAVAFSERNGFSFECTCVLEGSFAKANDVAVSDAAVTSETTRLRMKERENKTIFTSGHYQPLPARMAPRPNIVFPRYLLEGSPNKTPGNMIAVPGCNRTWRPVASFSIKNEFTF
jgi:hypothetical protein